MKLSLFIFGVILLVTGIYQITQFILDYNSLTSYGRGYVWGSAILILIGIIFIYLSKKINTK